MSCFQLTQNPFFKITEQSVNPIEPTLARTWTIKLGQLTVSLDQINHFYKTVDLHIHRRIPQIANTCPKQSFLCCLYSLEWTGSDCFCNRVGLNGDFMRYRCLKLRCHSKGHKSLPPGSFLRCKVLICRLATGGYLTSCCLCTSSDHSAHFDLRSLTPTRRFHSFDNYFLCKPQRQLPYENRPAAGSRTNAHHPVLANFVENFKLQWIVFAVSTYQNTLATMSRTN